MFVSCWDYDLVSSKWCCAICLTINKVGCEKLKVEKSCFMQKATFSLAEYLRQFLELKENKFDIFAIQALLYLFNQQIAALKTVIKSFSGKCGNVCSPRVVKFFIHYRSED